MVANHILINSIYLQQAYQIRDWIYENLNSCLDLTEADKAQGTRLEGSNTI